MWGIETVIEAGEAGVIEGLLGSGNMDLGLWLGGGGARVGRGRVGSVVVVVGIGFGM